MRSLFRLLSNVNGTTLVLLIPLEGAYSTHSASGPPVLGLVNINCCPTAPENSYRAVSLAGILPLCSVPKGSGSPESSRAKLYSPVASSIPSTVS